MVKAKLKNAAAVVLPIGSRRRQVVKDLMITAGIMRDRFQIDFRHFVKYHEPYVFLPRQAYKYEPLISIVVPLYNTPRKYLEQLLHSVVNQTYENWELVLGDGSTERKSSAVARELSQWDERVKYHNFDGNHGIAANTNKAIARARGEFVALLDHDDTLSVHALNEVVARLNEDRQLDILYSDEDKLSENGLKRLNPHFKPDWSPDLLRNVNYITHLLVVRKQLLDKVKGFRKGFEGAQDYDLLLRLVDKTDKIAHIPKILYHWREARASTASNFEFKKDILRAGTKALNQHLKRNQSAGQAKPIEGFPGFYKVTYKQNQVKPWTIVLTFPVEDLLSVKHVESLLSASNLHSKSQILTSSDMEINSPYKQVKASPSFLQSANDFIHEVKEQANTDYILFVGTNLTFPLDAKWPRIFQGVLDEKHVATMAPRQIDEGGAIKYLGYARRGSDETTLLNVSSNKSTYFGHTDWVRNTARQGSMFAVEAETFKQFAQVFDFNLKTREFSPDFFKRLSQEGLFHVVWSHTDFRIYSGMSAVGFRKLDYFNPNLENYMGDTVMKSYVNNEDEQ